MPHICLLPAETLLCIFATIYDHEDLTPISRTTLAALARTCRTFKEPALDILWKHVYGFKPLISCLPEGVGINSMQGNFTLKRTPVIRECNISGQYAQRIRHLTIESTDLDVMDDRVVQTLMFGPPPTLLLPNLRRLDWGDSRDCFIPLLRTLLRPTISSLSLDDWKPSFAKSGLLASLRGRCPSIRTFSCLYWGNSQGTSDVIRETVCGWRELVDLRTGILNAQALFHVASLSSLKSLHFRTCGLDDIQPNLTPTFTCQLNDVSIAAPTSSVLTRLLRNVHSIPCRSVLLCVEKTGAELPYDPLDIPDLIVSLSECFLPDLEQLTVEFDSQFEGFTIEGLTDPLSALDFDVFAPLLSFGRLTILDLSCFCISAIDDDSLKIMAQSWPQLEEFYFGGGILWLVPPSLTFIGLVHLIQHCRRLHTIQMPFHASSINSDSDFELFSKIVINKNISSIDVGVSPIADPFAVAFQLHTLLPNLTNVLCLFYDTVNLPPLFQNFADKWTTVNEFLEVLTTGAKMTEKIVPLEYSLLV
ncbi:hypothetical protein DEU56DRAFT_876054 [Suillus clintonianus]|uniref:uncharacterized protein n=1 Tax=Suillus clintonianus TaxID=1904413 RepID=UPI001B884916|nr:uncharacterized protein DEU56DRAFT_876054 [Suillus clintonianus]KAG2156171.1 hypothetical protein DEU56DRAFT_876054 [Suillus clintonianus]